MPTDKEKEIYVSIWAKAVDTQMHFNEMSVKSRQFGLAFVAAALGLGIVLIARGEDFAIPLAFGWHLNVSVIIALAGIVALWGVRLLDLNVYHQMLRGAVKFGEDYEENYMKQIFSLQKGMTQAITLFSQYPNAETIRQSDGRYAYEKGRGEEKKRKKARDKIKWFYNILMLALFILAATLFFARNFGPPQKADPINVKLSSEKAALSAK
jgi:hypothetical protein